MHCKSFLILIFYRSQSFPPFFKCWPIGDPFHRLGSLSTPPTSSTLNVVPLVLVSFDTVSRSTDQTQCSIPICISLASYSICRLILQRCALVLLVEIGDFFMALDGFYFIYKSVG